jgi:hypothetical protein
VSCELEGDCRRHEDWGQLSEGPVPNPAAREFESDPNEFSGEGSLECLFRSQVVNRDRQEQVISVGISRNRRKVERRDLLKMSVEGALEGRLEGHAELERDEGTVEYLCKEAGVRGVLGMEFYYRGPLQTRARRVRLDKFDFGRDAFKGTDV